jgi:hypothetical protein
MGVSFCGKIMKYTRQIILSVVIFTLLFSACSKYEDGPLLSLRSKIDRVEGVYHIDDIQIDCAYNIPDFLEDVTFEFDKEGSGTLSFIYSDTLVTSVFEWQFNDEMTDFQVRRFYLHKDTVMFLCLDSLYHFCFNSILPEYTNFQQAMFMNNQKWSAWGDYMKITELTNDVLSFGFENDTLPISAIISFKE